jgi:hypothetical protein
MLRESDRTPWGVWSVLTGRVRLIKTLSRTSLFTIGLYDRTLL